MASSSTSVLYKFCSAESAKLILSGQTLRWSVPDLLNDPLELGHTSELAFTQADLIKGAVKLATNMIFSRDAPSGNAPLLAAVRRWRDEDRFDSPEEAEGVLQELLSQMVGQRQEAIDEIMANWRTYTNKLRICCFCSKWDNLTQWQLGAQNHTGVALRFQLQDTKSFGQPQAVKYVNDRPAITTLAEQLRAVINHEQGPAQKSFEEKFTAKATIYKPQQEVRCFHGLTNDDPAPAEDPNQWFLDREFEAESLKGVYFGLNTSLQDKQAIWDLVKKNYKLVKIHNTQLLLGKYELEAERITEKPT